MTLLDLSSLRLYHLVTSHHTKLRHPDLLLALIFPLGRVSPHLIVNERSKNDFHVVLQSTPKENDEAPIVFPES